MKDFKSYKPDKSNADAAKLNMSTDFAKKIANAMNGKSQAQILKAVMEEAERGKRQGTLTNEDIDKFSASVAPLLDSAMRKKLNEIVAKLKEI